MEVARYGPNSTRLSREVHRESRTLELDCRSVRAIRRYFQSLYQWDKRVCDQGPVICRTCLSRKLAKLRKRSNDQRIAFALGNGIVVNEGELWKRQRRLIRPVFPGKALTNLARSLRQEMTIYSKHGGRQVTTSRPILRDQKDVYARALLRLPGNVVTTVSQFLELKLGFCGSSDLERQMAIGAARNSSR